MTREFLAVGAIHDALAIDEAVIARLLEKGEAQSAGCDAEFAGRPMTALTVADGFVLKERRELRYRPADQRRWIERALVTERELGVHHPAKTWVLLDPSGDEPVIANVTPLMRPLDRLLPDVEPAEGVDLLGRLLRMYARVHVEAEQQLDPGLSNFGLDDEGALYYLDDQTLPGRGLVSLAVAIAGWLRVLPWGDEETGAAIGRILRGVLLEVLDDPHAAVVVRDQLRGAFAADERQTRAFRAVANELVPRPRRRRRRRRDGQPSRHLALIADIHANRQAMDRALQHVDGIDDCELWVLGDIVGYGPEPAACVDRMRECEAEGARIIKGNHDHAVALGRPPQQGFSPLARQLVEWTVEHLTADQREWLMELPSVLEDGDWFAVHGAPRDPTYFNAYVYMMTASENLDVLRERGVRYCVHGHSHMPGVYRRTGHIDDFSEEGEIDLTQGDHWLLCPGSVGQPRSGQPGCELVVIDRETGCARFERLGYDIDGAVAAIEQAGLPSQLGQRLRLGR